MPKLIYQTAARRDISAILTYITKRSRSLAVGPGFVAALRQQCRKLASLPGTLGRAMPELHPQMRSFAFKGYVISFRYEAGCLIIVNVLEGHCDIGAYFADDTTPDT